MTLIIYDSNGVIYYQSSGNVQEPSGGLQFLWVEVPQGKFVESIDTSNELHEPVFMQLPKNETELLKEKVDNLIVALAEVIGGVSNA